MLANIRLLPSAATALVICDSLQYCQIFAPEMLHPVVALDCSKNAICFADLPNQSIRLLFVIERLMVPIVRGRPAAGTRRSCVSRRPADTIARWIMTICVCGAPSNDGRLLGPWESSENWDKIKVPNEWKLMEIKMIFKTYFQCFGHFEVTKRCWCLVRPPSWLSGEFTEKITHNLWSCSTQCHICISTHFECRKEFDIFCIDLYKKLESFIHIFVYDSRFLLWKRKKCSLSVDKQAVVRAGTAYVILSRKYKSRWKWTNLIWFEKPACVFITNFQFAFFDWRSVDSSIIATMSAERCAQRLP